MRQGGAVRAGEGVRERQGEEGGDERKKNRVERVERRKV